MLLPKRKWRDIEGFEGLYQVSNDGKVRSLNYRRTGKTKILKQGIMANGYKEVILCKNGKRETYTVHRLVAQAFIPNPNDLPCINHIDENKTNNAVWNLEWCTYEYNTNYATGNERRSKSLKERQFTEETINKMRQNSPNNKKIAMIDKNTNEIIKIFDSAADANEYLSKDRKAKNIKNCARGCNGQQTAYGYKWKYEEDCK